jgi:hypothetical protein
MPPTRLGWQPSGPLTSAQRSVVAVFCDSSISSGVAASRYAGGSAGVSSTDGGSFDTGGLPSVVMVDLYPRAAPSILHRTKAAGRRDLRPHRARVCPPPQVRELRQEPLVQESPTAQHPASPRDHRRESCIGPYRVPASRKPVALVEVRHSAALAVDSSSAASPVSPAWSVAGSLRLPALSRPTPPPTG